MNNLQNLQNFSFLQSNSRLWRTIFDLHSFLNSFTDIEFLRDYHLMMSKNMAEVKELEKRRTWTLLRATDFELFVYPCFCICWLLGYLFYMFEPSGYPLLKGCSAFSTSTMFIFVFSLLFTIYEINIGTRINYSVLDSIHGNMYMFLDGVVILMMYLLISARISLIEYRSKTSSIFSTKDFRDSSKAIQA